VLELKRRNDIREALNKIIYLGLAGDHVVVYIDRPPGGQPRLSELPVSRIRRVTSWAMILNDGDTLIPLHRVVEIKRKDGHIVWRRRTDSEI
jgi:uncharacterized protein (UPF0248 family)